MPRATDLGSCPLAGWGGATSTPGGYHGITPLGETLTVICSIHARGRSRLERRADAPAPPGPQ